MEKTIYTVTVQTDIGGTLRSLGFPDTASATCVARAWAQEELAAGTENGVYIEFYRHSDSQEGYINPDGASFEGKSWTVEQVRPRYKWANVHECLEYHIRKAETKEMYSMLYAMLGQLDEDTLQDLFQDEMDEDGFFSVD